MNFLYKFTGWLFIVIGFLFLILIISLFNELGFSATTFFGFGVSALIIWLGFWFKKTDPKLLQAMLDKKVKESKKWSDEYSKAQEDKAQEMVNALSLEEIEEKIAFAKKFRLPGVSKQIELLEKRKIFLKEKKIEAKKIAQKKKDEAKKVAQEAQEKEKEKAAREKQEENERRLKFLEDNKKLIVDSSLEEKIAKSYMNYKHTMGMPKKYVDDIYGRINDRKETVSKKGKTVKGKYIRTGKNQLGNNTYKYEMTFEDSILTGWKEL
jgi:hypothetical protein